MGNAPGGKKLVFRMPCEDDVLALLDELEAEQTDSENQLAASSHPACSPPSEASKASNSMQPSAISPDNNEMTWAQCLLMKKLEHLNSTASSLERLESGVAKLHQLTNTLHGMPSPEPGYTDTNDWFEARRMERARQRTSQAKQQTLSKVASAKQRQTELMANYLSKVEAALNQLVAVS